MDQIMANTVSCSRRVDTLRCLSEIYLSYDIPGCFQINSKQCRQLYDALIRLLDVISNWDDDYPNAWDQIYRAVRGAEKYLYHCSSDEWPIQFLTRSTTGEAYSLHLHDLVLCRLLIDVIRTTDTAEICRKIGHFFKEIDQFMKFRHSYLDDVQLIKNCEQFAERSSLTNDHKNIVKVSKFLGGKLKGIIAIPVSTEVVSAGADDTIPTWLKIDSADLVLKIESGAIGEGSFGHVYEGSWLGVRVAAKEMPKDAHDVFELEASILAKLRSPFIVHLIGTCIKDSHLYLVMELISSNLERLLEDRSKGEKPPFSLPVAVDVMLQISRAMEYLHSQGIMHLDLKSSNVLYELSSVPESREEGYGRVKLCDFGTASRRLFSFRDPDPKGTCYWRAPEAFPPPYEDVSAENYSPEKYTYKADVYSFGMTCYEILTGKQPFDGFLPREIYTRIVNGERPILEQYICPFILANYIQQCWDTDPDRRPCFEAVSNFLRKVKLCILKSPFHWNGELNRSYPGRFYPDLGYFDSEKKSNFFHKIEKMKQANLVKMHSRLDEMLFIWRVLTLEMRRGIAIDIASFLARISGNSAKGFLNPCLESSTIYLDWELKPIFSGVASSIRLHGRGQREKQAEGVEEFTNIQCLGRILVELSTGCTFVDFWIDYIQMWIDSENMEFIDPQLVKETGKMGKRHLWEVVKWCKLGLWCLSESPSQKPNIHTVLRFLKEGGSFNLPRDSTLQDFLSSIPARLCGGSVCGDWPTEEWEGVMDADHHLGVLWMRTVLS